MKKFTRKEITEWIVSEIKAWPIALACWEGGSSANKRADEFSDLDLLIGVKAGEIESALRLLEGALSERYQLNHKWRVPEPAWHGNSQCFYQLEGAPEFFFLDVVIVPENSAQKFLERARHGSPLVYFDHCGFTEAVDLHEEEFAKKREQRKQTLLASHPFYEIIVRKEMRRTRPLDALSFYRVLVANLIEYLGIKFRPQTYDFGMRYIYSDFPKELQNKIEKLAFVGNLQQIEEGLSEISKLMGRSE